ncbi:B2 protein [Cardamine amara subsp. amara]|uniref:B2 protein n=1 Tax=Cardamine amara subsp. amara TaxID=228776 RepID=A0ABD1ABD2_CARAN
MPKYRRMKHMEDSNGASGEDPEYGAIFMSNSSTRRECLRRELFGLPIGLAGFVKQVKAGMMLFLFEFESRELHGVFEACSDGGINIEPNAFRSSGKQFPAQVKFKEKWRCRPLTESEFRHSITENYFTAKKFNFGLSKAQVQRLLKLFSSKKVGSSRRRNVAVAKSERNLRNTVGNCGFRDRYVGETDTDVDREFPVRGHRLGRRLTENSGFGDESSIGLEYDPSKGIEYSRDTSGVFRRLVDPKLHGLNERVGYDSKMNNSFGTDAATNNSNNSLVNDRRVLKNRIHSASGWLENEYHEKDGIAQESSWSNDKEHLDFEADPVVPAQNSGPLDLPYGTNSGCYDPCEPLIMGDATIKSSGHDLGAPNVDSLGSASFTANSNYHLREEILPGGGYVGGNFPSETVQSFPDEPNGTSMNKTSCLGLDYYIPMPIEYREYQTNSGMTGVTCSEYESESRNGHMRHSQLPGPITSPGATENMRNFERLSYSGHNIYPSFAYPLSSRDLSPKYGVNNEILAYQHQEDFGGCGHVSLPNNMVARGFSIYPSFIHPSRLGDGADVYPENKTHHEVQAYQHHEESGSDAFDSNNRVIGIKDRVNPAELERNRTRVSVFKRLSTSLEEPDAEQDPASDTESVDEVMAFLNDCHKDWMDQKRPNKNNPEDFVKTKIKKEKTRTSKVLDNDLMLPFIETTPDDLLDCEESMEQSAQKLSFIDFKRRSRAQKSLGNPTQGCKDSPEHSASQNKKRKLLRPKLIVDDSEKDRGNNDDPHENVLASQSAPEVPFPDLLGCEDR